MTDLPRAFLDKASRALGAARRAVDADDAETAVNRAYYACFYAAQAALVSVGDRPKTHAGTHRRFALRFVRDGPVPAEVGTILPEAFRLRLREDYDALPLTDLRAAADLLADAERFVATVGGVVRG